MSLSWQIDEVLKKHDRSTLESIAKMVRLFDGYSVTPRYDWVAVRDGIAKMIEEMAESI